LAVATATPPNEKPTVPADGITATGKNGMFTVIFVPPNIDPFVTDTTGVPMMTALKTKSGNLAALSVCMTGVTVTETSAEPVATTY